MVEGAVELEDDGRRCPFCGGCPQCCNEKMLHREDEKGDLEFFACPTCNGEGRPRLDPQGRQMRVGPLASGRKAHLQNERQADV